MVNRQAMTLFSLTLFPFCGVQGRSPCLRVFFWNMNEHGETNRFQGRCAQFANAKENIFNDGIDIDELDGHYVDAVTFEMVPEPTTLLLLGLGDDEVELTPPP